RPILRGLMRVVGWAYWSKAVLASLLSRDSAALPAGVLDCTGARNEHGVYCVPRSARNKHEAQRILQSRVWEPETIDLLRGVDPNGHIGTGGPFLGVFSPP